jgi:hypothetical protein
MFWLRDLIDDNGEVVEGVVELGGTDRTITGVETRV